jgi:hypothetical protein
MTGEQLFEAVETKRLSLSQIAQAMDKKLLSLNIYYSDLSYTSIEEDPKTEIVEL